MRVAIIDDNNECINYLRDLIYEIDRNNIEVRAFNDGKEFLSDIRSNKSYQLVFLDIEMPDIDGISIAKEIHEINSNILIIFVTNYNSYISEAIRNHAFQYLVKPVKKEELHLELVRAAAEHRKRNSKLKLNIGYKDIVINIADIVYAESDNKNVIFYMRDGAKHECKGKLGDYCRKLADNNFGQCHKSFLVNLDCVQEINKDSILLSGGETIPVSRNMRNGFKAIFNKYLNGVQYDF